MKNRIEELRNVIIIFLLLDFSNPINSFTFTINAENCYSRNWGVYVQWVVSWFYVFGGFLLSVHAIRKEKNKIKRKSLIPLIYFITCPSFACIFHRPSRKHHLLIQETVDSSHRFQLLLISCQ